MSYDVGKATEGLENELWRRWSDGKFGEWALLMDRGPRPTVNILNLLRFLLDVQSSEYLFQFWLNSTLCYYTLRYLISPLRLGWMYTNTDYIILCANVSTFRLNFRSLIIIIIIIIIIKVFCPRTGPSLQTQEPRLQICQRQVFHRKTRNQGCSFTGNWISAIASRCFPHCSLYYVNIDRFDVGYINCTLA